MAKTTASKNGAPIQANGLPADFENWETEQLGEFPPYWNPVEGAMIIAKVIGVDYRDPEFRRIVLEAVAPVECYRGPKDDQEPVTVEPGERFTMSEYSLVSEIVGYLINLACPFSLMAKEQVASRKNTKNSYWTFELKMPGDARKRLQAMRRENALLASGQSSQIVHNPSVVA